MRAVSDRRAKAGSKPFQVAPGTAFEGPDAPTLEARTRGFLARGIVVFVASAVVLTGVYGLATGSFVPLEAIWAVGGPIIGAIVAYYFGPQRKDSG